MASNKLQRDFPYFSQYLNATHPNPLKGRAQSKYGMGCLTALAGAPIVSFATFMLLSRFIGPSAGFVAFAAFVISLLALFNYGTKLGSRSITEATPEDKLLEHAGSKIESLKKLDNDRKLPKWIDPVAIQLLEAGAYHWSRVTMAFDDPRWGDAQLPTHWLSLRERASKAAELAMAELVILCEKCVGEPPKNRKSDYQSVFDDFVSLDIEDAIRGLAKVTATHPSEYRFTSASTPVIFEEAKELAENLKSLADEVEEATRIAKTEIPELRANLARESIEGLLSEIRHVKKAESELHQNQSD